MNLSLIERSRRMVNAEPDGDPTAEQMKLFLEALAIYDERNVRYADNWRRFGWKGCIFRLRERAERAWDHWWYSQLNPDYMSELPPDVDDLLDLINFAAFTIRAIREGNRDGEWFKQR